MLARVLLQLLVLLIFAPLLPGVINKTKALFAGRCGPPLLQPYFDLLRLWRKGFVFSRTTTWVFLAGPVVGLAVPLLAAMLLPFGGLPAPVSLSLVGDSSLLQRAALAIVGARNASSNGRSLARRIAAEIAAAGS